VSEALVVNDLRFAPVVEQIRIDEGARLEIEIIPAWNIETGDAA
jgi:hypothetical protein